MTGRTAAEACAASATDQGGMWRWWISYWCGGVFGGVCVRAKIRSLWKCNQTLTFFFGGGYIPVKHMKNAWMILFILTFNASVISNLLSPNETALWKHQCDTFAVERGCRGGHKQRGVISKREAPGLQFREKNSHELNFCLSTQSDFKALIYTVGLSVSVSWSFSKQLPA